jgi:hypothetical protein
MSEKVIWTEQQVLPQRSVGEHEIFISFNDDDGAQAFSDWWHSQNIQEEFAEFYEEWQNRWAR